MNPETHIHTEIVHDTYINPLELCVYVINVWILYRKGYQVHKMHIIMIAIKWKYWTTV